MRWGQGGAVFRHYVGQHSDVLDAVLESSPIATGFSEGLARKPQSDSGHFREILDTETGSQPNTP